MVDVQGTVADGFEAVRDAFAANFTERGDTGAAFAVHRGGHPVVDLWGGAKDRTQPAQPWTSGTAVLLRSATKGPAAAVPHLLHQRGLLDLDAPVGTYWPEFKANGKERVLVRHLLSHRAGLPVLDRPLSPAEAADGVSGPRAVAAQAPEWEPGTAHGYHPHTFGWLLGELVQRVTGRTLGRWFAEEVAAPLGGLDLWLGLPPSETPRVARIAEAPVPERAPGRGLRVRAKPAVAAAYRDPDSLTRRAFGAVGAGAPGDGAPGEPVDENAPAYLAAGLPGSGGVGTARALSAFYASLIGGVDGGRRLFTPATLAQARSQESGGPDRVLVVNTRFGLGYMLHSPASPMLGEGSFGHPGRGGSLAFADPGTGIAFAYVTAGMQRSVTSDPRAQALVRALRGCLPD
ncbi:class A beta-lactamase-related serine hydrolase [Streptomyces armeniacus]|uniref:Class A beta-lactamase-related serine hydrolase n=1 Tax=Streptomyces armeniacus TaxID=83291 RepID=A0A345XXU9_9ACTN|nr:serine hydrolase domain-containing protein [Streptomyces armeniacus]AXK36465.1 class A beta-lactamase-related serine hydrolase [Streptomyces armeniacus]